MYFTLYVIGKIMGTLQLVNHLFVPVTTPA